MIIVIYILYLFAVFIALVHSDTGVDLVFMLDGTVNNQIFGWMKNFVRDFVSQLDVDNGQYRVGAMTYTDRPSAQFQLNRYNFQDEVSPDFYDYRNA